jgi:hypothetical protein
VVVCVGGNFGRLHFLVAERLKYATSSVEYTRVARDITCKRDNSFVTANVFECNAVISIQNSYSH